MRLPRVQFTVRRLMVGIAVAALILAIPPQVARLARLRAHYLGLVAHNARWEAIWRRTARGWEGELARIRAAINAGDLARRDRIEEAARNVEGSAASAGLFARRRQISERLASHPWESVPPDPAERRRKVDDGPVLIFEMATARLDFSSGLLARCALAPLLVASGYVALRWKPRATPSPGPEWAHR